MVPPDGGATMAVVAGKRTAKKAPPKPPATIGEWLEQVDAFMLACGSALPDEHDAWQAIYDAQFVFHHISYTLAQSLADESPTGRARRAELGRAARVYAGRVTAIAQAAVVAYLQEHAKRRADLEVARHELSRLADPRFSAMTADNYAAALAMAKNPSRLAYAAMRLSATVGFWTGKVNSAAATRFRNSFDGR